MNLDAVTVSLALFLCYN